MPAPRRRNTLFGFLNKGSKHKRIGGQEEDQEEILSRYEAESNISYQEDNICDDLESSTNHDRSSHHQHQHQHHQSSHEDESYGYPDERPEGTEYSTHSLTAKPTTATLAETFSSGAGQDHIHFVDSKDQSDVENSEFLFADRPHGDYNEYDEYHHQSSYTEFQHNATQEEDDAGTLDYTATVRDANYGDNHSQSQAARHVRVDQYNEAHFPEGIEAEWEDGSTAYDDTCSRTLNTNLEGMNYISDPSGPASYPHAHIQTVFSDDNVDENVNEPQYYYQDEEYDLYQESFGAEGYYYDDEGQLVGQSNQDEGGQFFDVDDQNTLGNSTIATEGLDPSVLGPVIHGPNLSSQLLPPHPEEDIPFDTYESDGTHSSTDDEETRDLSLLDDDDDEEDEDDGPEENNDKGDESDSDSDDDSRHKKRGRRRPKPKSIMSIITEMQRCSMKGTSLSYDEDDSSDDDDDDSSDDDDDEDDQEDIPGVAQVSTGATSMTSMTDSYRSRKSGQQQLSKKKSSSRKKTSNNNFDNLFNKVSALGQELLGAEEPKPSKKGKKSSRRREQDPATRIVESIRDIFSCGHPSNY